MTDERPRLERFLDATARMVSGDSGHPLYILQAVREEASRSIRGGAMANAYDIELEARQFRALRATLPELRDGVVRALEDLRNERQLTIAAPWMVRIGPAEEGRGTSVAAHFRNSSTAAPLTARETRRVRRMRGVSLLVGEERVEIDHVPFTIGRQPGCDLVIMDLAVSRVHAEIVEAGDWLEMRDRGSRNGLVSQGTRAEVVRLTPGTEITMGGTTLRVEVNP